MKKPLSTSTPTGKPILVAGGGPAGLMAAGQAAACGAQVLVLEKMARPGRKLCITGKGRCNLTNVAPLAEFLVHFGATGSFLPRPFIGFSPPICSNFSSCTICH